MNIGNEIEFITHNQIIPDDFNSSIEGIIHGNTIFKENKGIIEKIEGDRCLVAYTDIHGKTVKLAFHKNVLKLKKIMYEIY